MNKQTETQIADKHRRAFLQKMTATFGVAMASSIVSLSAVQSALAYAPAKASELSAGKIFTQPQMLTLKAIVDTILPQTDTPAASQLDCHGFMDNQLFHCFNKSQQQSAVAIVNDIQNQNSAGFSQLTPALQQTMLTAIEDQNGFSQSQSDQFKQLKALLVFGYFTTEIGATQALSYQAMPGGFKGSIKVDENTKAWSSFDFY
jgi:hypothetical protein